MTYEPRYPQPFTYAQALQFEIIEITNEISRLQNSLKHLERTQLELKDFLNESTEDDQEVSSASEENEVVIASQRERISMLQKVLIEKGLNPNSMHYGIVGTRSGRDVREARDTQANSEAIEHEQQEDDQGEFNLIVG